MNQTEMLNQKEAILLDTIQKSPFATQRSLSLSLQISLGQTNALVKSLMAKGELEAVRKNGRRIEYVLTERGYKRWSRFTTTKLKDAYHYISNVKKILGRVFDRFFADGYREFVLEGENYPLAAIVSEVFREIIGDEGKLLWGPVEAGKNQIILRLDGIDESKEKGVVNLLYELAKAE